MVYLIRARTTNHFKIGYTNKSEAKVRQYELQTGNGHHLDLIGYIKGDLEKEKEIQSKFERYRVINAGQEWFDLPDDEIMSLTSLFRPNASHTGPQMTFELLTPVEVAEVLRVSRSQVFRMIDKGDIPAIKFGPKIIRVRLSELENYVNEK